MATSGCSSVASVDGSPCRSGGEFCLVEATNPTTEHLTDFLEDGLEDHVPFAVSGLSVIGHAD